jgi:predicted MPP superfamily phosphohydrolase
MFFAIVLFVLLGDLAWWLWADRTVRRTHHPRLWRTLVGIWSALLLGYLLWFILFFPAARHAHAWMPIPIVAIVYLWHLLILPATVLFMLLETLALQCRRVCWRATDGCARRGDKETGRQGEQSLPLSTSPCLLVSSSPVLPPTRRQLLAASLAAVPPVATFASVAVALHRVHQFRIRRFDIPIAQLPPELDGMTIAHVSDVHVGRFTRASALPAIADAVNTLRADLVLFAGDLIDLSLADLPAGIDFLRKLDPRSGLFVVEGNHDLIDDRDGFEIGMRKARMPLLLDQSMITSVRGTQLQILGTIWQHGSAGLEGSLQRLAPQRRPDLFQILLAHHPHALDQAAIAGIPLTISGHTHGGQLMLNERLGAGPMMFKYWSGLYRKESSALVVSNGVGNWFPLRINAPAEIIHLTLHRSESGHPDSVSILRCAVFL